MKCVTHVTLVSAQIPLFSFFWFNFGVCQDRAWTWTWLDKAQITWITRWAARWTWYWAGSTTAWWRTFTTAVTWASAAWTARGGTTWTGWRMTWTEAWRNGTRRRWGWGKWRAETEKNTYDLKLLPSTLKSWNMKRSWSNKLRSWRNNLNCMTMRARTNMKKTLEWMCEIFEQRSKKQLTWTTWWAAWWTRWWAWYATAWRWA